MIQMLDNLINLALMLGEPKHHCLDNCPSIALIFENKILTLNIGKSLIIETPLSMI